MVARSNIQSAGDTEFLPSRHVLTRYNISSMTLWRWLNDPRMNFPRPVYLGRLRYWRRSEIEDWEQCRVNERIPVNIAGGAHAEG